MKNSYTPPARRGFCREVRALYGNTKSLSDRTIISVIGNTAILESVEGSREQWKLSVPQPAIYKHFHLLIEGKCYEFDKSVAKCEREKEAA